jgi:oligopeptide transport system substrate-binding protein
MKTKSFSILALLIVASMVLAACGTTAVETVIVEVEGETVVVTAVPDAPFVPKVLLYNWGTEPPTADPALATDTTSVDLDGQLFMGLTNFSVEGEVIPWLATDWSVSDDGLTWTFNLRDDIPWVAYNTGTAEVDLVYDADGNQRFVNATDVVYATKRTIDPETASDYAYVLYIIKGAQDVNTGAEGVTVDDIGVVAIDDTTVAFTLESPAGFFPAIAGMWVAAPVPQWTIEAAGDKWTQPGTMVSNGPYVMTEWIHGSELNLAKNPYWPDADTVDIDEIHGVMVTEASTAFAMYENGELHTTGVPMADIDRVKADPVLSLEFYSAPAACTYYYGMVNNKAPFDDVRVRKAFAMTVDKASLVENVTKGGQQPAGFFAPPGIFGRPDDDSGIGLDYDVAAANALLDEYLAEKGLTRETLEVTLMHNTSEGHAAIAAAIQQFWMDNLGVDVTVENQEWKVYLDTIGKDTPLEEMPHIFRLGWCADYPDENNWVYEVFNADAGANRLRRGCVDDVCAEVVLQDFDNITEQAKGEQDPAVRKQLYIEAETLLSEVEAAYIPIYFYTSVQVTKPELTREFATVGHQHWYWWTLE